jgi:hypothetical protein
MAHNYKAADIHAYPSSENVDDRLLTCERLIARKENRVNADGRTPVQLHAHTQTRVIYRYRRRQLLTCQQQNVTGVWYQLITCQPSNTITSNRHVIAITPHWSRRCEILPPPPRCVFSLEPFCFLMSEYST